MAMDKCINWRFLFILKDVNQLFFIIFLQGQTIELEGRITRHILRVREISYIETSFLYT